MYHAGVGVVYSESMWSTSRIAVMQCALGSREFSHACICSRRQVLIMVSECWHVLEELARGTFGVVFRVMHRETRAECAMERVDLVNFRSFQQRTGTILLPASEHTVMRALDHPNIVVAGDFELTFDAAYLLMDLCPGTTWLHILLTSGPLPPARTIDLATQLARAAAYMHECGVMHRDIKPENVVVDAAALCLKLVDFGLARQTDGGCRTILGSAYYAAPEVRDPARRAVGGLYCEKADVWSVGVTFYEAWCASPPWDDTEWSSRFDLSFDEPEWDHDGSVSMQRVVSSCACMSVSERLTSQALVSASLALR